MASLVTVPFSMVVLSLGASSYGQTTVNCTRPHQSSDHDDQHGDSDDDDDNGEDDDPGDQCHSQDSGGNNNNNNGEDNNGGGHKGGGHDNSTTTSLAAASTSTSNAIGQSGTSTGLSPSGTAASDHLASGGSHFNKASIAGIILGLICCMALVALIFTYLRKRRRERMANWLESKKDYEGGRAYSNIGSDDGQNGNNIAGKTSSTPGGVGTSATAIGAASGAVGAGALAVEFADHAHSHPALSAASSSYQSPPYTDRDSILSSQGAVSVPVMLHPSSANLESYNRLSSDISTSNQSVISNQPYSSISTPIYGIAYPNPVAGTSRSTHPPSSFPPSLSASVSSNYPETSPSSAYQSLLVNPYDEAHERRASMASQRSSLHEDMVVSQKELMVAQREVEVRRSEAATEAVAGVVLPSSEPPPEYRQYSA